MDQDRGHCLSRERASDRATHPTDLTECIGEGAGVNGKRPAEKGDICECEEGAA